MHAVYFETKKKKNIITANKDDVLKSEYQEPQRQRRGPQLRQGGDFEVIKA